jgi:SAM-dependent methyltransferase
MSASGSPFADHFSTQAEGYARHRPGYPRALFDALLAVTPGRHRAWDCGCGNGQVARDLAPHFTQVLASDPSAAQLAARPANGGVAFLQAAATPAPLATASCDLITVGQALHWFPHEAFYTEARRVLRPGGVLAAWCYSLLRITPRIDAVIDRFYRERLGRWWPAERALVDSGYRDIPFPFDTLPMPRLAIEVEWDLEQLGGYLATWSAYQRCRRETGLDPLPGLLGQLAGAWGDPARKHRVRWPLHLRVGRA